jgi:hypothetical protein
MALPSSLGRLPSYTNAPGAGGFEKLQNSPFGSGSLTAGLSQRIQQSGGLGDTRGTPVGRSTMNPERALAMQSRGTARPGQVEAALGMENLQRQRRQDARAESQFQREEDRRNRLTDAYIQMTKDGQTGGQTGGANPPPPTATGGANPPPPPVAGGANPPPPTATGGANAASPTTAGIPNPLSDAYAKLFGAFTNPFV